MVLIDRNAIFELINIERDRQDKLHPIIKTKKSVESDLRAIESMIINYEFLAVLSEEFGEVGSALQGDGDLKEELIHVASVAVRWLENLK